MKAKLEQWSSKLIVEKTERNAMLLLEYLEERQESLPMVKMKTTTHMKDAVHGDATPMYHIRFYDDGKYASETIYKQCQEYINNNQAE
jgi:hypothetical protein